MAWWWLGGDSPHVSGFIANPKPEVKTGNMQAVPGVPWGSSASLGVPWGSLGFLCLSGALPCWAAESRHVFLDPETE